MRASYNLIFLIFTALCFSVFAEEGPYIEQVVTHDQDICLQIGDSWLVTQGLQASGAGTFVHFEGEWMPLSEAVAFGDFKASWVCGRCGRKNMDGINACPYCGKSKTG